MVLVQGLDVAALAVNVLLIYFSRQPGTFTKKVKVGGGSAILLASYFHFAWKIIPHSKGTRLWEVSMTPKEHKSTKLKLQLE